MTVFAERSSLCWKHHKGAITIYMHHIKALIVPVEQPLRGGRRELPSLVPLEATISVLGRSVCDHNRYVVVSPLREG